MLSMLMVGVSGMGGGLRCGAVALVVICCRVQCSVSSRARNGPARGTLSRARARRIGIDAAMMVTAISAVARTTSWTVSAVAKIRKT